MEQHYKHIKKVFGKINEYGFRLTKKNCEVLMKKKFKYLGQVCEGQTYQGQQQCRICLP